jgi:hypothetical protein
MIAGPHNASRTYNQVMPPRHAYWTILIDDQPTAFRAHDPEELVPTLNRLREKNPTAVMKWFERGQLFDSRDAARQAGMGQGERRWEGPRPEPRHRTWQAEPRDKNWRPGGDHRDPRQPYKDAKKAKWTRFKEKIRERHEQRLARDPQEFSPPHGDPLRDRDREEPTRDKFPERERAPKADRQRPDWRSQSARKPRPDRQEWGYRDGAPSRPHGDKYRDQRPQNWRTRDNERRSTWKRDDETGERERGRSEWRDRPPRREDDRRGGKPKGAGRAPSTGGTYGKPSGRAPLAGGAYGKPSGARPPRRPFGAKPGGAGSTRASSKSFDSRDPARFRPKSFGKKPFGRKPLGRKPPGNKPGGPPRRRDDDE